ncbi:MAG: hypothetical protein U0903_08540 [Planctomycetales bacterium]
MKARIRGALAGRIASEGAAVQAFDLLWSGAAELNPDKDGKKFVWMTSETAR